LSASFVQKRIDDAVQLAFLHGLCGSVNALPDDRRAAGSRLSSDSESSIKRITKHQNQESKNAGKPRPSPDFLVKSNTFPDQIAAINQRLPNTSRATNYSSGSRR
jgi:hypothetical protein